MINADTQEVLTHGIEILTNVESTTTDAVEAAKIVFAKSTLVLFKAYSNSSNGIPALRGLGLEEAIDLATYVIVKGNVKGFQFASPNIFKGFRF